MVRTKVVAAQTAPASPPAPNAPARGASIEALSEEILAAIFSLLSIFDNRAIFHHESGHFSTLMVSVPRVCRKWRAVCRTGLCRLSPVKLSLRPWLRSGRNPDQRTDGGLATEYVPATDASLARGLAGFGGVIGLMYNDFDIILDRFSRVFQLHPTPHAMWAVFYLVPRLTSC